MADAVRWPGIQNRTLVLGRTGSGKTVAACNWLLWYAPTFERMPWVVVDSKGDELIEAIGRMDGTKHIKIGEAPGANGLHIVRPRPDQLDEVDDFLWRIHARNNVGLYFDEGYTIGKPASLNAVLTQGRSKNIPVILLSQRPAWLSGFCFSEASYFQCFPLTDARDRQRVREFVPIPKEDLERGLPEYHSIWYDVGRDRLTYLSPVPPSETILKGFRARLQPKRIAI